MSRRDEAEPPVAGAWRFGLAPQEWPAYVEPFPDAPPPAEAYTRLCRHRAPFWLDSALNVSGQGRYAFLGCDPTWLFRCKGSAWTLRTPSVPFDGEGDPFRILSTLVRGIRLRPPPDAPPFVGGAVGYFGYDLRAHVERLPCLGIDDLGVPDAMLGFYTAVLAYDQSDGRAMLCCGEPWREEAEALRKAVLGRGPKLPNRSEPLAGSLRSNFSRAAYLAAVGRIREYIAAGDIYQASLSQRFTAELAPPYQTPEGRAALYRRLRAQTPAPYAAILDFGEVALLSASPERFLRISGDAVETRPIKGTRRRGATPEQDAALAEELLNSAKDHAELVMIVDLERNDLGRVCRYGSVHVPELFRLESHPTVHHLVATVRGQLRPGVGPVECLRACFPGGSITGAPKIRAMQIIEELEPTHRGPYTGAIGYLGWNGEADLNIAIRTMTLAGDQVHFQVGGGIVADSDPEAEFQETLDKGRALARALGAGEREWDVRS